MPSIKYKEKTYAGASFPCLELTKAQYNALSEEKKMDGTVYMITDDDGGWEAERSVYDNSESGLSATNVQDALDEIVGDLGQATGSWVMEVLSNQTYGSLIGYINTKLKIALMYWSGNSTNSPTGGVAITIPERYKPPRELVVPMKSSVAGSWMGVRIDPQVYLHFASDASWTNATIMYPLA